MSAMKAASTRIASHGLLQQLGLLFALAFLVLPLARPFAAAAEDETAAADEWAVVSGSKDTFPAAVMVALQANDDYGLHRQAFKTGGVGKL